MTTETDSKQANDSELKPVWLMLLKEGGQWNVSEILDELPEIGGRNTASMLFTAAMRGYMRKMRRTDGKPGQTYGVTMGCKIPRGTTLEELAAVGAIQLKPEDSAT